MYLIAIFKKFVKPFIALSCFVSLSILFYFSLLDALQKSKDLPIQSSKIEQKLSGNDLKMHQLFEKSVLWSTLPKSEKKKQLLKNPVYSLFNITAPKKKKRVDLLLIISSGPRRGDRRKAIRQTWWKQCVKTFHRTPECLFFTDRQYPGDEFYESIQTESQTYKDIHFQHLRGGIEFGVRFLYHMVWSVTHYHFDYFIRVDDDYFFCLQRFLYELPWPMEEYFHWGFTHCLHEIVRPEESMILLSQDLVFHFLLQDPHKIRCHPWADQMIGVWVTDLNMNNLYRHDDRLHHRPIVDRVPQLRTIKNICDRFIGIHGTYPEDMFLFWKNKGENITDIKTISDRDKLLGNLKTNSDVCELVHHFNYLVFEREWQYEPQRCIYDPVWNTDKQKVIGGVYSGRQEDKHLSDEDVKLLKKLKALKEKQEKKLFQ